MKTKLHIVLLVGLLLFTVSGVGESKPLTVDVQVDEVYVREGDTVQVTWLVNGGTPPYGSWIYWDAIWTEDTWIGNYGNQYHSIFKVRPGMMPLLSFRIEAYDEFVHQEHPLVVYSSSLGMDIVNLEGWTSPGSTQIVLDRAQLRIGEMVTANVYRAFDPSIEGYYGFQYQWGTTDANGKTSYTDVRSVTSGQYNTALSFSPMYGSSGFLKVIAAEPLFTEDDTTKIYYSEPFTIYDQERTLKVGQLVNFGRYEQDNNTRNGREAILWRVLAIAGNRALLISHMNLDAMPFNNKRTAVGWQNSTLRHWLNQDFLNAAFTPEERSAIVATMVNHPRNPYYGTGGGADTWDSVFLLSIEEVERLFANRQDMRAQNTAFAKARKAGDKEGYGWWWLRTAGNEDARAAGVYIAGGLDVEGNGVQVTNGSVRPALWYDLDAGFF